MILNILSQISDSSYSIQKVDNNTLILYSSGYILDDLIHLFDRHVIMCILGTVSQWILLRMLHIVETIKGGEFAM